MASILEQGLPKAGIQDFKNQTGDAKLKTAKRAFFGCPYK